MRREDLKDPRDREFCERAERRASLYNFKPKQEKADDAKVDADKRRK